MKFDATSIILLQQQICVDTYLLVLEVCLSWCLQKLGPLALTIQKTWQLHSMMRALPWDSFTKP